MTARVERLVDSRDRLGECPLWDGAGLWWVDIHGRAIKRYEGGALRTYAVPEPVGSIALRAGGGLLAAMQTGIFSFDPSTGKTERLVASENPALRFNDGRVDRAGRFFWVGTLQDPGHPPLGALYRLSANMALVKLREGIRVPNSLAWSPDGRTMYFADSPRRKIRAFDYEPDTGAFSGERLFAAPHPGFPDGSCVDADGCLWNARYGGARVVRYTPEGKVDRVLDVPAQNPTCCCFGGAALDTLYVTTEGGAGLFAAVPGVRGLPESRFAA